MHNTHYFLQVMSPEQYIYFGASADLVRHTHTHIHTHTKTYTNIHPYTHSQLVRGTAVLRTMGNSEDASDYSDGAVLTGQNDFVRWRRELHERAEAEDIAGLIHPDEGGTLEELLTAPGMPPKPENFTEAQIAQYQATLETFKFNHKQYTKQQERRKTAKKLVMKSVDPSIRLQISGLNARDAYVYLCTTFSMPDPMAQSFLYSQISSIHLNSYKTV